MKTEYDEQVKLVQYLNILKKQGKIITFWATSNENNTYKQDKKYAMINEIKLKRAGKRAGVCDMFVLTENKLIAIEMKKAPKILKSGKLSKAGINVSDNQIKFLKDLNKSSIVFGKICFGFNEAKEFISNYID